MENVEQTRVSGLLGWLEEEQHQSKAQIGRLQYQVEQLANLAREQAGQIRSTQEELAAARNQMARMTSLDELVRQLRESLARLQAAHTEHTQETDKEDKARQADIERSKQAISDIWLRIESMYREFEPLLGRVQSIGDMAKRNQEATAELVKNVDGLVQQGETLVARIQLAAEQGRRNEGEIERIARNLETLRTQDDILMSRLQIVADKVRQVDEQIAAVLADEQSKVDLSERIQVLRLEQERLEKQLTEFMPVVDIHTIRLDEQTRELRQVDERRQVVADGLTELRQALLEHAERLESSIIGVEEIEERHKRRQVLELELQANELKARIAKLRGQVQ